MNDKERLARALEEAPRDVNLLAVAEHLIDSGLVTVNPPPDPAEWIVEEFRHRASHVGAYTTLRSMLWDRVIVPGPACEGVVPDPVTAAEREVVAAAEDRVDNVVGSVERMHRAVRALREARS